MLNYLIVGAGMTGIALGRLLQQHGESEFLILEKEAEPGGLCRTVSVQDHHLDIGGGHFLCTKYPEVYEFIFSHLPKSEFNFFQRVSKIAVEGNIIDYPIESNLWQLPEANQIDYLISVAQSGELLGSGEPENYENWIRWKLGEMIAQRYMLPYNRKIWGVEPGEMDVDWLSKIPRFNLKEIFSASLRRESDPRKMPSHSGFYYPKKGGFQEIFNALLRPVTTHLLLNTPIRTIRRDNGDWVVNDKYRAKHIVNTAPWTSIYGALGEPEALRAPMGRLKTNSIVVSLWERKFEHNWHWCYCPDQQLEWHREFFIHNFAPHSNSCGFYTETNVKRWPGRGGAWNCRQNPIFEHVNESAYPIPVVGHADAIREILEYYRSQRLFGLGRWGQWQYYNSDVCIWEAMQFVREAR